MEIGVRGKDLGELERLLGLFETGKLSGALTVARLLLVSRDVASIERWLLDRVTTCTGVRTELLHLIEQHRHGCLCVAALHGQASEVGPQRALGAAPAPAAHDKVLPERIPLAERAIRELAERFDAWSLLGRERRTLGLGCGAGRMEAALSARVAFAAGVDASQLLIARARWCFSRLLNTRYEVSDGHDLSAFEDASFQLVYAIDPVPSLFGSGDASVTHAFAEVARVLAKGGELVIVEQARGSSSDATVDSPRALALNRLGFELVPSDGHRFRWNDRIGYRMRRG